MNPPVLTSLAAGFIACHVCGLVLKGSPGQGCPRCGTATHSRKPESLSRTWALLLTAAILYVPANLYPIMTVIQLGRGEPKTILSGVMALIKADMWPLALIVFVASIVVPTAKLIILSWLLFSIQSKSRRNPRERTMFYRIMETFGHWSMVDVYLVTILVSLVKMDTVATIEPGIGISFFGAVVVLTLLAARAFDPRLIWDSADDNP